MTSIAVFASGRGSNFDAILGAVRAGTLNARIVAMVSDQPGAVALEKARAAGIPTICVPWTKGPVATLEDRRRAHEEQILRELSKHAPNFVVMAGYMRVVTSTLIEAFRSERGYSR